MSRSNLMIRLIDIVFILLFGFIAVSQIGSSNPIEPPKSTEAIEAAPDNAQTVIIGVTKDGSFPIDAGTTVLKNINELHQYLMQKVRQAQLDGSQLGIRIRANWDSPVEHGLAVARLCRDMGIPKGLDVIKLSSE